MTTQSDDVGELVKRLHDLVIIDEVRSDNQLGKEGELYT